jgi:hypothetical protein
LSWG